MPVVYAFNGTNQPPRHLVRNLWGDVPSEHCFALFALHGTDPAGWYLYDPGPDMALLAELIAYTDRLYDVDNARRYLEGGSAGAHFVHWLGPARTDFFSGIFAYAGSLGPAINAKRWPPSPQARRIPVFIAHGMNDMTVPYSNGTYAFNEYERLGFPVERFDMDGHCCDTRPFPIGYAFLFDNTPK